MDDEIVVAPRSELARAFAARLGAEIRHASASGEPFPFVVPGGSVAEAFFPELAATAADWSGVDLFWSDERVVPPQHPDSNFRRAVELWLGRAWFEPERVHRMRAESVDLEAAAAEYERALRSGLGSPPRLALALVGVGEDGHVASLFPGHAALAEPTRWVVPVVDAPKPPARRLTLTLPLFAVTDLFVAAAFGVGKAEAIREALEDPASTLPLALAARLARRRLFLLDPEAASRLAPSRG